MTPCEKILVGVHFGEPDESGREQLSPDSEEAVRRAIRFAAATATAGGTPARLRLCHVFPVDSRAWASFESVEGGRAALFGSMHEVMDGLIERAAAEGVEAEAEYTYGKPWVELTKMVEGDGFDLAVVGNRKRTGFFRGNLGTTAQRLMLNCPCPVWIVRVLPDRPYQSIVIPVDLSPISARVLRLGFDMARKNGSACLVVHCVETWSADLTRIRSVIEEQVAREAARASESLDRMVASALQDVPLDRPPAVEVETGDPDEVIWRAANAHQADLLVMGMVGRTGLSGMVVGNTAMKILPEVDCALLTVKPAEFRARL